MVASKTRETYLKIARSLESSFRRRGLSRAPESYADEIERRSSKLRGSSLRMYKRSAIYRLESIGDLTGADRLRSLLQEREMETGKRKRLVRRVPDALAIALLEQLESRGTAISKRTRDLLLATMVTGLRPIEWSTASLSGNILTVQNAKFKENERANGPVRELELLSSVTTEERTAIERTIAAFKRSPYDSQRPNISVAFKEALGAAIRQSGVSKWFYRLRVYDFRHQFSADAKSSWGIGEGTVAAAMGHAVEDTAIQHYGRAKHGTGRSKVKPTTESIAKVRRLYTTEPTKTPTPTKPEGPPSTGV